MHPTERANDSPQLVIADQPTAKNTMSESAVLSLPLPYPTPLPSSISSPSLFTLLSFPF